LEADEKSIQGKELRLWLSRKTEAHMIIYMEVAEERPLNGEFEFLTQNGEFRGIRGVESVLETKLGRRAGGVR
jgi:glutamate dehydrogenase/leucine dehydrogenase